MKSFRYTITEDNGIHARPAGLLVKEAVLFESEIMLKAGEKNANAKRLMSVMSLGIRQGMTVEVTAEGPDEEAAIVKMQSFFEQNL